uniref:Uncharacterized protein MANES_02G104900 n=1 Tax=Rhizophora mucronata TaxID=61149 RepID=A0A2P2QKZ1_RHIMU
MMSASLSVFPLPKNSVVPSLMAPRRTRFRPPSVTNSAAATTTSSSYGLRSNRYSEMALRASLYEVLGIPVGASGQEIKSAYRRLARTCHPDVAALNRKDSSADEFMKIHVAYSTLSDPEKRALYDRKLFRANRRPLTSGLSRYRGRNWETDQCW